MLLRNPLEHFRTVLAIGLCASTTLLAQEDLPAVRVLATHAVATPSLKIDSPRDFQVLQRTAQNVAKVLVSGQLTSADCQGCTFEARVVGARRLESWHKLETADETAAFNSTLEVPAGGWYRLQVRAQLDDQIVAMSTVEHFGVGEIFVVAGQSNSANHGEEKLATETGRVATLAEDDWQLAIDPQPGASGRGGSFMPPFGDALVARFDVPVGFVACGIGATSVREWLPRGATFPNPPTLVSRVEPTSDGRWASKGEAFALLVSRIKQLGPEGFRAVLWHQGESDANQKDPTRTLDGELYQAYLAKIIRESRREIGWDAPWFVAQVSYHVPDEPASPSIRAAQAAVWQEGIALPGPDTDQLTGPLRAGNGQGVHFSATGLRAHAARWAEKVIPWLTRQLGKPTH
jgi:hypothetical protein